MRKSRKPRKGQIALESQISNFSPAAKLEISAYPRVVGPEANPSRRVRGESRSAKRNVFVVPRSHDRDVSARCAMLQGCDAHARYTRAVGLESVALTPFAGFPPRSRRGSFGRMKLLFSARGRCCCVMRAIVRERRRACMTVCASNKAAAGARVRDCMCVCARRCALGRCVRVYPTVRAWVVYRARGARDLVSRTER